MSKAVAIIFKSIDEKALAEMLLAEIIEPLVLEFVKDTNNPFVDKVAEYLLPLAKEKLPLLLEEVAKKYEV